MSLTLSKFWHAREFICLFRKFSRHLKIQNNALGTSLAKGSFVYLLIFRSTNLICAVLLLKNIPFHQISPVSGPVLPV